MWTRRRFQFTLSELCGSADLLGGFLAVSAWLASERTLPLSSSPGRGRPHFRAPPLLRCPAVRIPLSGVLPPHCWRTFGVFSRRRALISHFQVRSVRAGLRRGLSCCTAVDTGLRWPSPCGVRPSLRTGDFQPGRAVRPDFRRAQYPPPRRSTTNEPPRIDDRMRGDFKPSSRTARREERPHLADGGELGNGGQHAGFSHGGHCFRSERSCSATNCA